MKLSGFLIGLLVFGLFVSVMFSLGVGLHEEFGVTPDNETVELYEQIENSDLYSFTNTLGANAPGGGDVDVGSDSDMTFEDKSEMGTLQFLSVVPQSYSIFKDTATLIIEKLGVDGIFLSVAIAAVVVIISIILVAVWRRVAPF